MFDNLDYNQYAKMRQRGLERQAQQLQQKQAALQAAQNQPKKTTLEQALGGLITGVGERLNDIGNTAKNVGKTAFGWFNELVSGGQTDNTMKDDSKRRNDIAKKYGFNSYSEAINSNKVGDDFWNEIKGSNAQTKKTLDTQINDYRNSASGKLADVTKINTNEAKGQALNTIDSVLGIIPGALPNVAGGALSGIGDEYKAAGREGRDFNWNQAKNNAIVGAGSGLAGAAGSALAGKAAAKAGGNALGKLLGSNVARGAAGGAAAGATGGALGAALNGGTLEDALLAAKEGAKAGGIGGGAMAGAMGLGGKALERFRNGKNGRATAIDTSEPVDAQIVQKNRIEAPNQRQLASTVEAVEPISTRRGIAITDLDAGEQPVNIRNARQTLKNNTKNPSYYYYPEEQSIKPIEIDANGNYNVTDGINTIKTINGKVGTYNGSGDWKGAKVFDGQDGRGIPEGYKLMANENAAPSNEYVAIVNRSGEKALIKLPQASDYDYERVGLATGTTRESLANSGLIESANDYKPSKPYTKNGRKYIDGIVRGENLPEAELPTLEQRFKRNYGDPLENIIANGDMGNNYNDIVDTLVASGATADDIARLKTEARGYAMDNNPLGETVKGNLPKLNLDEYKALKGITKREDINPEMLQYLRKDGRSFNDNSWSELFPDRIQDNGSGFVNIMPDEIAEYYENVAATQSPRAIYTPENIGGALVMNPDLNQKIQQQMLATNYPTTKINIEKALAQTQDVPVENLATNYRKSTIPARQYNEQAIQNMPEAEIATRPTTAAMEAPEPRVATQRQVAVDPATQAILERKMYVAKQRQGEALLSQYGTLERPYRRMVGGDPAGVLNELYDDYGLKTPSDVQFAANHVTGKDGTVSKMTRKLAASAENVPTAISEDFINELLIDNGLTEAEMKSIKSQIQAVLNRTGADGYSDGSTTLQTIKNLEGKIRDIKGENGTYHNASYADKCRASALQSVRDELTDRLWANADIKTVMTEDNLNTLRNMYKDNPTWQDFVNNRLANAKDGAELRALMKPLVNGAHIIEGAKMTAGSFAEKAVDSAAKASSAKGATKNIVSAAADTLLNSEKAKQKRAEKYYKQAKTAESQLYGETPVTNTSKLGAAKEKIANAGIVQGAKNLAGKAGNALVGATESLNNDTLAGINGIRVGKNYTPIEFDALGNQAGKFANKQMGSTTANAAQDRLESARTLANAQADYDNALADYQASEAQTNALTQQMQQSQSQLGRIEQAMQLALNAGDITAYSQLADLYKQAAEIEELKNPTKTTSTKALSANQAKALTAQQQLDALSRMTPDAGTVASNIPILSGIVNLTGGNEYANQASSLATTLGYLLSGANIKESEAQRIGQAYVPTAFDSEAVRKQKLERARQLIQSYMSDTGAIEQ